MQYFIIILKCCKYFLSYYRLAILECKRKLDDVWTHYIELMLSSDKIIDTFKGVIGKHVLGKTATSSREYVYKPLLKAQATVSFTRKIYSHAKR